MHKPDEEVFLVDEPTEHTEPDDVTRTHKHIRSCVSIMAVFFIGILVTNHIINQVHLPHPQLAGYFDTCQEIGYNVKEIGPNAFVLQDPTLDPENILIHAGTGVHVKQEDNAFIYNSTQCVSIILWYLG